MKRVLLVLFFLSSSLFAFSQMQLQLERSTFGSFGDNPVHGGYWSSFLSYNFKCGVGVYNFSEIYDSNWYESVLGLNYRKDISKSATAEIGFGVGKERWYDKVRYNSYLSLTNNPNRDSRLIHQTRFYACYEFRKGAYWLGGYISHNIAENFALGASYQSDAALGPRFDAMFWFTNVWVVPGYFREGKDFGVQAGLSFNF